MDVAATAGLMTRKVERIERDGRPAVRMTASRSYPTSVEDLWDAVSTADRIPRWFLPVTGDLHVGGRFQLEGNAGGEVLACEPPHRFEITWENGDDVSWVTVVLSGEPDGAEALLELHHVAHVPDEMWDQYGPGAVGIGWELGLMGLGLHVETGEAVDVAELQAWETSDDAAAFRTASSDGWCEASIVGGTDPEQARAAAATVLAFYTPPPADDPDAAPEGGPAGA